MKKVLFTIIWFLCTISISGIPAFVNWQNEFPYETNSSSVGDSEKLGSQVAEQVLQDEGLLNKFLEIFGFNTPEYDGPSKALIYIKWIINLLLGLTSFIALIMVIYSFYLLFFSEDTKGMDKVKKNLKGVAIALILLWLSRTIVSFIFNFYQTQIL